MTCPACGNDANVEPILGALAICPSCTASLVLEGYHWRRATGADTTSLSQGDLTRLRKAREQVRKAQR